VPVARKPGLRGTRHAADRTERHSLPTPADDRDARPDRWQKAPTGTNSPTPVATYAHRDLGYGHQRSLALRQIHRFLNQELHAFGDPDNIILYGIEHETEESWGGRGQRAYGVLTLYRPIEVAEAKWLSMTLPQREALARELRPSRWLRDFTRLSTAPPNLEDILAKDGGDGTHEVKFKKPVGTLMALFKDTNEVKTKVAPEGRTQYTVSWLHDPKQASHLTELMLRANEYMMMRTFAVTPNVSLHNYGLPPDPEKIREALAGEDPSGLLQPPIGNAEGAPLFKLNCLGLRTGAERYGDPRRVAFEVRALMRSRDDSRRVVMNLAHALQDPEHAEVRFGRKAIPRRLDDTDGVEHFSHATLSRLPAEVRESGLKTKSAYAYPLVQWEERPGVPLEVAERTARARETYLETARSIGRDVQADRLDAETAHKRFMQAIHEFCRTASIHDYL
jgi:hypothetical protein